METLAYILKKYNLDANQVSPIEIPNTGRDILASLFHELGYKVGAEIGTEAGRYAETLCRSNPGVKLYCVDPYETYSGYRDYLNNAYLAGKYDLAKERLAPYDVTFVREYSADAVRHFPDDSLDFVYIDGNHEYLYVTQDIFYWERKVRPGGIIAGHDYYRSIVKKSKCHVIAAVNGYTFAYRIHPWFILGSKAKAPGMIRDNSRSWFWVKE